MPSAPTTYGDESTPISVAMLLILAAASSGFWFAVYLFLVWLIRL
jgi:hypothetical protein